MPAMFLQHVNILMCSNCRRCFSEECTSISLRLRWTGHHSVERNRLCGTGACSVQRKFGLRSTEMCLKKIRRLKKCLKKNIRLNMCLNRVWNKRLKTGLKTRRLKTCLKCVWRRHASVWHIPDVWTCMKHARNILPRQCATSLKLERQAKKQLKTAPCLNNVAKSMQWGCNV